LKEPNFTGSIKTQSALTRELVPLCQDSTEVDESIAYKAAQVLESILLRPISNRHLARA
jgi:hypothetical protein